MPHHGIASSLLEKLQQSKFWKTKTHLSDKTTTFPPNILRHFYLFVNLKKVSRWCRFYCENKSSKDITINFSSISRSVWLKIFIFCKIGLQNRCWRIYFQQLTLLIDWSKNMS